MRWLLLSNVDNTIIVAEQRAYLWLLDRTGIYVASIMSACVVLSMGVSVIEHDLILAGFMGVFGLASSPWRWYLQHTNETTYNAISLLHQQSSWRGGFVVMVLVFILMELLLRDLAGVVTQVVYLFVNYMQCIQIRKREPKKFFESVEHMTPQTAGGQIT